MEYRRLGRTGLMVSELCLGTMTFGRELDEEGSRGIINRFLEVGGNFVDTADVYETGLSEEITGRAMKHIRDDVVLATKACFPMGYGPNDVGLSCKHVLADCEASLRRLGTDYMISIKCTCETRRRPWRRPCLRSRIWYEPARYATSGSPTSRAGS